MAKLSIILFGKPQIMVEGVPISLPTARGIPLIAYLAISGKSQSREALANILWTESSQKQALAALRTTLWRLKSAGLDEWITLDHKEIGLNPHKNIEIDVLNFKYSLDKCNTHGHPPSQVCLYCTPALTEAVTLYQGEFLSGLNISRAPEFDDWRIQQSEALQAMHLDALERLVKCHRSFGDFNLAIHYARIWLNHDRLHEGANYQLMQLYAITGQRNAGLALYKHYKETLWRELAVQPGEELALLYKQIRTGQAAPLSKARVKNPVFLIAEIENPSQYWVKVGGSKNRVLTTQFEIFRDTAHRFGGRVIQKSDESTTLLFENGQPLHCAVTIHMKIQKADWGVQGPPSLRMVLYSTIIEGDNPISFAMLTRVASSLMSISWGGQVVFTEQTLRLLDTPSGATFKDLGFHFLDNIEGNIHVYELLHPNLPHGDHPPLQSRSQQLVHLPVLSPAFIGREQELDELERLIKSPDNRVVTLVGPGGIGKTRLAIQFASKAIEYFPEGVYFVSLASVQDPDLIPIPIAEALKFSFYGPRNHTEQLGRYIHRMKILLVLDNFEQLRAEGAKHLSIILGETHHVKFLITSRERLNLLAEAILELRGMPVPITPSDENLMDYSSIKLFIQNAQKTYPGFDYRNNLELIARVCQQVDGIPLGILLASSWARVFGLSEIADEIKRNIDFLSTSAPDIDPRHRSLRAVFDHSWELLSGAENRILRRLSIFMGAFTALEASAICDATPLVLATFADKSLLMRRQDKRFEMLATFQQYAAEKLKADNDEFIRITKNYCGYYADFCNQQLNNLNAAQQYTALEEISAEYENIRNAWIYMVEFNLWDDIDRSKVALLAYHGMIGKSIQGRELFRMASHKLSRLNDPGLALISASMLQLTAWMTIESGFTSEGIIGLDKSLETFRQANSPFDIAMTLAFLAQGNRLLGKKEESKKYIEEALQILHGGLIPASDYMKTFIAYCQSICGLILLDLGDYDQARENMIASLEVNKLLGNHYGTIQPLSGLGRIAFLQGEFIHSRDLFLQAMETATRIYDRRGMALLCNNLAAVYEEMANISESYQQVTKALKLSRETGDRRLTALITNNMAFHQVRYLHQPAEAIRTYQETLELFSEVGDLRGVTFTCYDISRAYLKVGLVGDAWTYAIRALHTAITLDNTALILHTLHGFVYIYSHLEENERALRLCFLIINHPGVEEDTQKRAIVSRVELETDLAPETIDSAQAWSVTANLQDVIDQILTHGRHI